MHNKTLFLCRRSSLEYIGYIILVGLTTKPEKTDLTKKNTIPVFFGVLGKIKGRIKFGLGVAILENPYFLVGVALFLCLILILSQILLTRSMITHANIKFEELDYKLGEIVQKLIADLPIDIDSENQVTPIQAFIMDMVRERMNPAIQVKEITQQRDRSGKFT